MESSFHLQSANVGKFLTYQKLNYFFNRHRYLFCCLALLSIAIGQLGCGKPTLRRVASELAGLVRVAELNIDENLFIKKKYEIDLYTVLLLFVNDVEVKRLYGLKSKDELLDALRTVTSGQHEVTAIKNPNNGRTKDK